MSSNCKIKYIIEDGGVPCFEPTMEQFADFNQFMHDVHSIGEKAGIIKVIPPKEWIPNQSNYADVRSDLRIQAPIKQHVTGRDGVFRVLAETQPDTSLKTFSRRSAKLYAQRSGRERAWLAEGDFASLEGAYWKNLGLGNMRYGADTPSGSLFDQDVPWNVSALKSLLSFATDVIPGVNTPMLYIGDWKATFAIHVEDANLFSINYIHVGAPKQWYAIPARDADKFESFVTRFRPPGMKCSEYLRHKDFVIKPARIREAGISLVQTVHHERFNHGWNVAESANFATEHWFPQGEQAHFCQCRSSTVRLDVESFKAQVNVVKAARDELVAALEREGVSTEQLSNAPISMTLVEKYPHLLDALREFQDQQFQADDQSGCESERREHMSRMMSAANVEDDGDLLLALANEAIAMHDDDDTLREEFLPVGTAVQLECGYADCDHSGVFRNREALLKHYQTRHSTAQTGSSKSESSKPKKSKQVKRKRRTDDDEVSQSEDVSDDDEDFSISLKQLRDIHVAMFSGKEPLPVNKPSKKTKRRSVSTSAPRPKSLSNNHSHIASEQLTTTPVKSSPTRLSKQSKPPVIQTLQSTASVNAATERRTSRHSRKAAISPSDSSSRENALLAVAQLLSPSRLSQTQPMSSLSSIKPPKSTVTTTPVSVRSSPVLPTRLSARLTDKWLRESTAEVEAEQAKAKAQLEKEPIDDEPSARSKRTRLSSNSSASVTTKHQPRSHSASAQSVRSSSRIAQLNQAEEDVEDVRPTRSSSRIRSNSTKPPQPKKAVVAKHKPSRSQTTKAPSKAVGSHKNMPKPPVLIRQPIPIPIRRPPTLRDMKG